MQRAVHILFLAMFGVLWGCDGCGRSESAGKSEQARVDARPAVPDAGVVAEPEPEQRDAGPPKKIFAKRFVAKVRVAPSKEAFRRGYLRAGAILMAKTAEPVGHDKCRKGWYELETGGFVCSTVDVIAYRGRRPPERRATQPDLSARLPYPYGRCRRAGTPVYRRLPSDEEAAEFEGYRIPGQTPVDAGVGADAGTGPGPAGQTPLETAPGAGALATNGSGAEASTGPGEDQGQGEESEGTAEDAPEEPAVATLESLQGDPESVLQRRMERGFYVSLDRKMRKRRRKYWRTQSNGFIPHRRLVLVEGSDFSGIDLEAEGLTLPVAWVMSSKYPSYRRNSRGRLVRAGKPGYHHRFVPASTTEIRGRSYVVDTEGVHYRARHVRQVNARPRPEGVGDDEKWIDVDLATQSLVAYVGDRPVFATLVSTGRVRDPDNPLRDHRTPTGAFRLTSKHLTATMDGDHAIDGPYSIEDVPYVMYFQLAYAFHSAFWHNSFGRPRSHGCVNLAPADARFLFRFATPELPEGWHGVYPQTPEEGTRVFIHGETPEG